MVEFLIGLILGAVLVFIGDIMYQKLREEWAKEKDNYIPFAFKFPNGTTAIKQVGHNYFEYTYKGNRILAYKPGTSESSMVLLK